MPRQISLMTPLAALLFLSLIPGTAFACTQNDYNCYWNIALQANRDLNPTGFFAAVEDARAALSASESPSPEDRAVVLRLEGIEAVFQGDEQGALQDFRAARRLDPAAELPSDLFPPQHPVARLYAAAGPPGPARLIAEAPAAVIGDDHAAITDVTVIQADPERLSRDLRRPLLGGAALSGLVSGGLLALAASVPEVSAEPGQDPFTYQHAEGVALSRQYALRTASGATALVGAGLLTAGLTVRW